MDFLGCSSEQKSFDNDVKHSIQDFALKDQSAASESESELDRFRSCLPSLTMVAPQISLEDRPVFYITSAAGKVLLFIYR